MFPSLDFIKTMLSGITVSFEKAIKAVERKIVPPDYTAEEGQAGYIKNKPTLVGKPGAGEGSVNLGHSANVASGVYSFVANGHNAADAWNNKATGQYSAAFGISTNASGYASFAEGNGTRASANSAHAEGENARATGDASHAEGGVTIAEGYYSHAEGYSCHAMGDYSHAEGYNTTASGWCQHVQGKLNIEDTNGRYAHIVGNGTNITPSNAHTLDWEGNAWFAGTVEGTALILKSPGGKRFQITVDDNGALSTAELTTT